MRRRGSSIELLDSPIPLPVPLEYRRTSRARRVSIKVDVPRGRVVLVAPYSLGKARALDFLERNAGWLHRQLAKMPEAVPFTHGGTIPLLGVPHRIHGDHETLRGRVEHADQVIRVPGAAEHLPRRLTDYLKAEAKREIGTRARAKAAEIGASIKGLTLRDTVSRWGSCNRAGRLSFSWRLILAPESVLDYVVAHEVAHLAEMNHGPRFWKLCKQLSMHDSDAARDWLRQHGHQLHRYG
jgi:predicted metal-dependent hydrolase